MAGREARILTLNGGSSSIKLAVFEAGDSLRRMLTGEVERIGFPDAALPVDGIGNGAPATDLRSIVDARSVQVTLACR